ncbi:hypothetical protein ACMYUJ_13030 [Stutzerimonas zhaodongensis]|uniref:hypothetical protein n=1 Tax=Stutzerimonas zhaodongensis TaxID=1176257 RepID=UPI0039EEBE03
MGRKRAIGLEWLDPRDINQRYWAIEYLLAKGYQGIFYYQQKIRPGELPSHEQMLHAGTKIEQNAGARELLKDMKDAWRQQRNRNNKKQEGHLVCTFTLNGDTKKNLKKMANELNISATALVENLIAKAYQTHIRKQAKQPRARLAKTPQGNRSDRLRGDKENYKNELPQASASSSTQDDNSSSTDDAKVTNTLFNNDFDRAQEKYCNPIKGFDENTNKRKRKRQFTIKLQDKIDTVGYTEEYGPLEVSSNHDE